MSSESPTFSFFVQWLSKESLCLTSSIKLPIEYFVLEVCLVLVIKEEILVLVNRSQPTKSILVIDTPSSNMVFLEIRPHLLVTNVFLG